MDLFGKLSVVPNSNLPGLRFFVYCICIIMWHSHLNDMEIPETKRFIPKGFELGTTLSQPNRSIVGFPIACSVVSAFCTLYYALLPPSSSHELNLYKELPTPTALGWLAPPRTYHLAQTNFRNLLKFTRHWANYHENSFEQGQQQLTAE